MKITMDYKKGILFIRIKGDLIAETVNEFNENVIPVVLSIGSRNIVINFENINKIDSTGIDALKSVSNISKNFNGKSTLCSLNRKIFSALKNENIFDYFLITDNELSSLEAYNL